MKNPEKLLSSGDLRSTGKSSLIITAVQNQEEFDELFQFLFHKNRLVRMRTADVLEKISATNTGYLKSHKKELIQLLHNSTTIELQWHLAQLISRIPLTDKETAIVWNKLYEWAMNKNQSRIVRVNSLQSLFDLSGRHPEIQHKLNAVINKLEKEQIPSITARIKKLKTQMR